MLRNVQLSVTSPKLSFYYIKYSLGYFKYYFFGKNVTFYISCNHTDDSISQTLFKVNSFINKTSEISFSTKQHIIKTEISLLL